MSALFSSHGLRSSVNDARGPRNTLRLFLREIRRALFGGLHRTSLLVLTLMNASAAARYCASVSLHIARAARRRRLRSAPIPRSCPLVPVRPPPWMRVIELETADAHLRFEPAVVRLLAIQQRPIRPGHFRAIAVGQRVAQEIRGRIGLAENGHLALELRLDHADQGRWRHLRRLRRRRSRSHGPCSGRGPSRGRRRRSRQIQRASKYNARKSSEGWGSQVIHSLRAKRRGRKTCSLRQRDPKASSASPPIAERPVVAYSHRLRDALSRPGVAAES